MLQPATVVDSDTESVSLGPNGPRIRPLGIGTWAWGDSMTWGYGRSFGKEEVRQAFRAARGAGITLFDTAEIYGLGESERLLGGCVRELEHEYANDVVVATKFFPLPWRLSGSAVSRALEGSLGRLRLPGVGLYQVHWPIPPLGRWADGLADAVSEGLTSAVGVSNYSPKQTLQTHDTLLRRGVPLASNQVRFSLLDRSIELNGLLALCADLGITVIAYSPLAQGLLSGKYGAGTPPPGWRGLRAGRSLGKLAPLIGLLREIGQEHGGKTPSQVSLNWVICKGAVPIPGAKNASQATENAGALGWRLTAAQILALEMAAPI